MARVSLLHVLVLIIMPLYVKHENLSSSSNLPDSLASVLYNNIFLLILV